MLWALPFLAGSCVATWLRHLALANLSEEGERDPWGVLILGGCGWGQEYFTEKGERLRWLSVVAFMVGAASSFLWAILSTAK